MGISSCPPTTSPHLKSCAVSKDIRDMSSYRFKDLHAVPESNEMVDIAFSTTQRKTPNLCHKQWKISRIRKFYTRKVKYCGQMAHMLLSRILDDFPRIDEIHPFYGQLMDVIYKKDLYKVALGQVNRVRGACDRAVQEYVRMMKYSDSQFKCKCLKTACFGKIGTYMKKLRDPLKYLEECRKHMSRLPQINPTTRSLLVCGYPNVGKSSFMNQISEANVEVESYAFTTKDIYVGHFDYQCLRWQVLDTPGLLDRENRRDYTVAENQAILALAHIQSTILFIIDISETCGFKLTQQVELFHKIKELFANKPVLVVLNKSDLRGSGDLNEEEKKLIESMKDDNVDFIEDVSTLESGNNVIQARDKACDMLIERLVDTKARSKRMEGILSRITVVEPTKVNPRRQPTVPNFVGDESMTDELEMKLLRDECEENGGVGVFQMDGRKEWKLANDDWAYDAIPEFFDGKNVKDFIDSDIIEKLKLLEEEEGQLVAEYGAEDKDDGDWETASNLFNRIAKGVEEKRQVHSLKKGTTGKARSLRRHKFVADTRVEKGLAKHGFQTDGVLSRSVNRKLESALSNFEHKEFTMKDRRPEMPDVAQLDTPEYQAAQRRFVKQTGGMARAGHGDKEIHNKRPKHLFSGKRGFDLDRR